MTLVHHCTLLLVLPPSPHPFFRSKVPQPALHRLVVNAQWFSSEEGQKAGFIDEVSPELNLLEAAHRQGAKFVKGLQERTLSVIRQELYFDLHHLLTEPIHFNSHL